MASSSCARRFVERNGYRGLFLLAVFTATTAAHGQFTIHASHGGATPGASATTTVTLDNGTGVRSFQLGLAHDAAVAALVGVSQGSAIVTTNGGAGPDYFFVELAPTGGSGFFAACVVSLALPFDEIPVGAGHELAIVEYAVDSLTSPGALSDLTFVDHLGDPAVPTTVATAGGISHDPLRSDGSITVLTPVTTDVQCFIVDPCQCSAAISWVNGDAYDEVQILRDGGLVSSLPGGAINHTEFLPGAGTYELCVVGLRNGQPSAPTCCMITCAPPVPAPVTGLSCSAVAGCEFELIWTNPQSYGAIEIAVDGTIVDTLPGSATSTTVDLGIASSGEVCVIAICQGAATPICCVVTCEPSFIRGDANGDGALDVADAVSILAFLFNMGTPSSCADTSDVNDDGGVDIGDAVSLLSHLFGTPSLVIPPPNGCGPDPTADAVDCQSYSPCP